MAIDPEVLNMLTNPEFVGRFHANITENPGGYRLNSGKDSDGREDEFLAAFVRYQPQIEAYKRANGGDYEGAFKAVVGIPWPAGRSVKVNNGVAEMTKDRTVKSVTGKYVLPIAAGVLTGGAALGAFGGAAAAGGAAGAAGSGAAGTAGAAGTLGATTIGTGFVPAIAGGTGLAGAGTAAGLGAATAAGVGLGETAATTGLANSGYLAPLASSSTVPAVGGLAQGTTSSLAGTGTPTQRIIEAAKTGKNISDIIGAAGSGVADATQAAGENRISADETRRRAEEDYEQNLGSRSMLEADERSNANKDVYRAGWYQNRESGPFNPRPPQQLAPNVMATLSSLERQGIERLAKAPQYSTTVMPPLKPFEPTPPSGPEKAGTVAGPILKMIDLYLKLRDK